MAATYLFGSNRFESAEQGVGAMGGETHLSRSGYCASLLRRRNWRLFVGGVSLFTVGVALLWVPPSGIHYWPQFFEGPRRLHSVDLDAGTTLPTNAQWVQIQAMQPLDTGVETQGGHYLLAHVEGYPLLIHVETRDPKASYRGELKVINQTLRTELVKKGYRVGSPEFPSLYLETTDDPARAYRSEGVMDLVFASPVLLVGFTALWLSLRRALDYRRHPFARSLARRGSATAFVQEIDAEMAGGARAFKRLRITSHWLIVEKFWTAAPMRMSDVVWVYYKYDKTGSYCVACDRWRESLEMSLKSATAKKVQKIIAALAPRAVDGYDAARKQLWESEKDAAKFPDLVRTQASPGRLG